MTDRLDAREPRAATSVRSRVFVLVVGGLSLVALSPVLGDLYSSLGTAARANVLLVAAAIAWSGVGFASTWSLQRLTLGLDRLSDVAGPQLAGNAASNLLPAGSAFGLVLQLRMLRREGVDLTRGVTSLTIAGLVSTIAGLMVFPVLFVLPVGDSDIDLAGVTRAGVLALVVCVPLVVVLLRSDRVLRGVGRACHRAVQRVPRCRPPADLAARIVDERDRIREAMRQHKTRTIVAALGRGVSEYLALYASLLAVGLRPSPPIVLAAFVAGNAAGMIPFTPGGLGFVEAGLSGVLVLSGAGEEQALAGVAIYRLATTWLPVLAGVATYLWSRVGARAPHPEIEAAVGPAVSVVADVVDVVDVADVAVEPVSLA